MDGYELLAEAIILQAVKDYRKAMKKKSYGQVRVINKFFRSDFFSVLSTINPELLIQKLNAEVVNE